MFAITTRNKLRSARFAPNMIWAWRRVRTQLGRTPGMLAYTTGLASPTEFITLTLWEKEIDMFLFMSSDDHRDMMWNFRHWTESFWSMRWNATREELGNWNGLRFARSDAPQAPDAHYAGPGRLDLAAVSERLRPILANISRPLEPTVGDARAVICRVVTPTVRDVLRLKRLLRPWHARPGLVRFRIAIGLRECLIVAIWPGDPAEAAELFMCLIAASFPDCWSMRFRATDFEVGHWGALRFRPATAPAA